MSPRKRTSPWRPSSAKATEIFILEVSRPTKTALSCCMARPLCVRLGTGLSGATRVRRIARDEPPPLQQRTYGLPGPHRGRAKVERLAGAHDINQGLEGLLHGRVWIEAVDDVKVDVVRPKAVQRGVDRLLDVL